MIVDFRLRPPFGSFKRARMFAEPDRTAGMCKTTGMRPAPSLIAGSVDLALAEMKSAGITLGVLPCRSGAGPFGEVSNAEVGEFVREHSDSFVGFAAPDPSDLKAAPKALTDLLARPEFCGVVLEPGLWPTPLYSDDEAVYPIYEQCQALNAPVIIMAGGNAGPDITYTAPAAIDRVARDFPNLRIVATHGGWPWVTEILHVAFRRPNLFISPDVYIFGLPGWRDYVDAGNGFLQDRLLFASAYPFGPMPDSVDRFKDLFEERVLPKLLYQNALTVLNISEPKR